MRQKRKKLGKWALYAIILRIHDRTLELVPNTAVWFTTVSVDCAVIYWNANWPQQQHSPLNIYNKPQNFNFQQLENWQFIKLERYIATLHLDFTTY